jgi:hypothetical protein
VAKEDSREECFKELIAILEFLARFTSKCGYRAQCIGMIINTLINVCNNLPDVQPDNGS